MERLFCLTFGQQHPLRDNWIIVSATNEEFARQIVSEVFGNKWSGLYTKEEFQREYFRGGQVGLMLFGI